MTIRHQKRTTQFLAPTAHPRTPIYVIGDIHAGWIWKHIIQHREDKSRRRLRLWKYTREYIDVAPSLPCYFRSSWRPMILRVSLGKPRATDVNFLEARIASVIGSDRAVPSLLSYGCRKSSVRILRSKCGAPCAKPASRATRLPFGDRTYCAVEIVPEVSRHQAPD